MVVFFFLLCLFFPPLYNTLPFSFYAAFAASHHCFLDGCVGNPLTPTTSQLLPNTLAPTTSQLLPNLNPYYFQTPSPHHVNLVTFSLPGICNVVASTHPTPARCHTLSFVFSLSSGNQAREAT